jgi:RNA polymerase sigma factor (sigma-70 family)
MVTAEDGMKNRERFLALYEEHGRLVRGFLLAATGCPHQADDLQQSVARVLLEKFADYDDSRPFRSWVLGIARIEALKWRQRLARRREVLCAEAITMIKARAEEEADSFAERRERLPGCVAELPDASRRLLNLRYEQGLGSKDIAVRGSGTTRLADPAAGWAVAAIPGDTEIPWKAGDLFTLPALSRATLIAATDAAIYWVHDEPLLRYLGAEANRLSVLFGHRLFPQTMTITHVLWAMFGVLPVGAVQAPHRHQSVAVDLVVDAKPGCSTLVGKSLNKDGSIKDGERFDWEPHSVFVTPPGLWHSHHNESRHPATSCRSRTPGSTPTCARSTSSSAGRRPGARAKSWKRRAETPKTPTIPPAGRSPLSFTPIRCPPEKRVLASNNPHLGCVHER